VALAAAVAPFAVAVIVGLLVLWPGNPHPKLARDAGTPASLVDATVTSVTRQPCPGGTPGQCANAFIKITSGPDRGQTSLLPDLTFGLGTPTIHDGDKIVVGRTVDPSNGRVDYYFSDFQRRLPLLVLALAFAALVVGVARWRGLAAIAGLAVTWLVLVRFVIPAVLGGESPVAVALIAGAAIMFVVVYLAHGVSARTTTALLGTLASLALTGLLAAAFVAATHLTGYSSDEATYLQSVSSTISLSGLVLGGIIIGSLGVLNDVTVTQASAAWEIHGANPALGALELYRSGMRVGRDHIASVVYTLVLAYAGVSLPLLIVFSITNRPLGDILTGDLVAEELVRTFVGGIGLVASVPITTALASFVATRRTAEPAVGEGSEGNSGAGISLN
jgi:uncharacterized membrane protein